MSRHDQHTDVDEILALLDGLPAGQFHKRLKKSDNPLLQPIVDKLNSVVATLEARAQDQAQAQQLDKIFLVALDLMCIANTDGYFKKINPSFTRILGYTEEELLSQTFMSFIHPDDREGTGKAIEALSQGIFLFNFENRFRTKSGEYRLISWHCQPNTKTGDLFAFGRDVTEERKSEIKFRQIIKALNQTAIVAITDKKGKIIEVNDNFCKISGYSRDELLGKDHRIINSKTHSKEFFKKMWETIASGNPWSGDIQNKRKNGELYWVRTVISPLVDPDKEDTKYIAIRFDVTEQKNVEKVADSLRGRIEAALNVSLKNEKAFRTIFDNSPIGIIQVNSKLEYVSVNAAYQDFLGYTESELQRTTILNVTHPDDRQSTLNAIPKVTQNEPLRRFEKRYIHKSGRIVWGRVSSRAIRFEENGELYLFSVVEDITHIKEREVQTALTFETMNDGLVIQDENGTIKSFNSAALTILGIPEDQLLGRTSLDPNSKAIKADGSPFPAEEHPAMVALRTGRKISGTLMGLKLPTGKDRWIRINATPFVSQHQISSSLDKTTIQRQVICTFSDVTDLISSQNENRFILDALQIGVWKFNPVDQSLHWDKSMYRLFDVREEDFSGHYQAWENTLTPGARAKAVEDLGKALRGEKEFDTVFEIQTKSRGRRFISGRGKVIRDPNGNPIMMYGINMDVTAQKLTELERERVSKLLEVVLQNVPSMIFVKDYKNNLSFSLLNKSGEILLGLKEEQFLGKNDYDFFPKEQADFFTSKDKQVFISKSIVKIDKEEIDTPNGRRILTTYKVPTFDENGDPQFLIGISNDITEEVKVKQDLELERAKSLKNAKLASLGEMSAGIAHEINNPLAIIVGSIRLLSKFSNNPEKQKAKIETIERSCERIAKIVSGLKKFSRSGDKANFDSRSLCDIIQEATVLTEAKAKRHGVPVTIEFETRSVVNCDEVEIEQVLINLINNSIDAVKDKKDRWIRVSVFEDNQTVVLRIMDSGNGIPEQVRNRLFEPFFTTKKVGEGTGLGLSITKGILDEHKATIAVLADLPNTCFEIRFPKVVKPQRAA